VDTHGLDTLPEASPEQPSAGWDSPRLGSVVVGHRRDRLDGHL